MIRGTEPRHIGHNPAGGLMIIGLLVALLGTALSGWMMTLGTFWGVGWVEEIHELLANLMLIMVAVHIASVVFESFRHKENLVRAMISGRKRDPVDDGECFARENVRNGNRYLTNDEYGGVGDIF